ncbi:S-adenosyl-L-methionine-dependent methyltransferase [Ascodesmis nigricans]|uniref:S-adenosyl-L-methionine-dependent methyltransferase n=1 Tax=Ascodesmis nigricans TaxID=341454 RepID=A0A4S2MNR4_9PEZI|nr:S-adenosyl-L-methionine-dependent methyltransferase [Ascodesmis nigricans]
MASTAVHPAATFPASSSSEDPAKTPLSPTSTPPVTAATFIQVSIAQPASPQLEPEPEHESDQTMGDEEQSEDDGYESAESGVATESVWTSIRDYVYENGRRYHRYSEGSYILPNDEMEMERLELVHHQNLLLLRGSLCITPIEDVPMKVLDCGTGTGIWALDFAESHPKADVVGVDLSPIQPAWVWPNVRFEVDDIEKLWTYPENHFDFIYSRHLGQSIKDWKNYLQQMYTHSAPDGRIELIEHAMYLISEDGTYNNSCDLAQYINLFGEATTAAGMRSVLPEDIIKAAEEAGFVEVEKFTVKVPWGAWPKHPEMKSVGETMTAVLSTGGFEAFALQIMTRHLGMHPDKVRQLGQAALKDVVSRKVHSYQEQWYIIGRKPRPEELDVEVEIEVFGNDAA